MASSVTGTINSLILSLYEQKAAAVLLTLLHLGIKNIRLGPTLPAFVTPAVLNVLVEKFAIKPIGTAEADIIACLSNQEKGMNLPPDALVPLAETLVKR